MIFDMEKSMSGKSIDQMRLHFKHYHFTIVDRALDLEQFIVIHI